MFSRIRRLQNSFTSLLWSCVNLSPNGRRVRAGSDCDDDCYLDGVVTLRTQPCLRVWQGLMGQITRKFSGHPRSRSPQVWDIWDWVSLSALAEPDELDNILPTIWLKIQIQIMIHKQITKIYSQFVQTCFILMESSATHDHNSKQRNQGED